MSKRKHEEPWWVGDEQCLVDRRIAVVWNREVGRKYPGKVTEYNHEQKRHKVEFDDGDVRWFRMERKIFEVEEPDGTKLTYEGEMQVRRLAQDVAMSPVENHPKSPEGSSTAATVTPSAVPPSPPPSPPPAAPSPKLAKPSDPSPPSSPQQSTDEPNASEVADVEPEAEAEAEAEPVAAEAEAEKAEGGSVKPDPTEAAAAGAAEGAPAKSEEVKSKPKTKPKKINKNVKSRSSLVGTMTRRSDGASEIEGWWDEVAKRARDPEKRKPSQTFKYTFSDSGDLKRPSGSEGSESDSEDEYAFEGANCFGHFFAMAASEEEGYQKYEDDMKLRFYADEEDDETESDGESEGILQVRGVGSCAGGGYRVTGTAVPANPKDPSGPMNIDLKKEFLHLAYFEQENAKCDKAVAAQKSAASKDKP